MALLGRQHDDNSERNQSEDKEHKKLKSRKPPNTAFRQQRLLAYSPILTPKTVLPLFFAIGVIFGPIGGLLLYASSNVFPDKGYETDREGPRSHDRLHALRATWQCRQFHLNPIQSPFHRLLHLKLDRRNPAPMASPANQ